MDPSDPIVPPAQIDGTPYGACVGVAAITLILFSVAFGLLWKASSWTKRHGISISLPSIPAHGSGTDATDAAQQALDAAKQAAGTQVKQAANQAVQSAADSAKEAAQQQASQAAQDVGNKLQNALK